MDVSTPLLSAAGILAALVAMLVDGRRAVVVAVVILAAGMAPSAATFVGAPALAVLGGCAVAAVALDWAGRAAARRLARAAGPDPITPAFAPRRQLFGPRSVRVLAAALAVPIASWVSFKVPLGQVAAVTGLLFPAAYAWSCGVFRLVVARSFEDLAVGMAMVTLATGAGWLLRAGPDAIVGAVLACSVPPLAALLAGWMAGRNVLAGTAPEPAP